MISNLQIRALVEFSAVADGMWADRVGAYNIVLLTNFKFATSNNCGGLQRGSLQSGAINFMMCNLGNGRGPTAGGPTLLGPAMSGYRFRMCKFKNLLGLTTWEPTAKGPAGWGLTALEPSSSGYRFELVLLQGFAVGAHSAGA